MKKLPRELWTWDEMQNYFDRPSFLHRNYAANTTSKSTILNVFKFCTNRKVWLDRNSHQHNSTKTQTYQLNFLSVCQCCQLVQLNLRVLKNWCRTVYVVYLLLSMYNNKSSNVWFWFFFYKKLLEIPNFKEILEGSIVAEIQVTNYV